MPAQRPGQTAGRLFPAPVLLLLLTFAPLQSAPAQDCVRLVCGSGEQGEHCAITPSRLTAQWPAGFVATSIRGNTMLTLRGEERLQGCTPVPQLAREVSLDKASLYGAIQVAGRLQVAGTLRYEPNDGGELAFLPAQSTFQGTGRFFRANFRSIKLDEAQPPVAVRPPRHLARADCWQASATAQLSDFSILVGDTSAAGTSARRARITAVHGFTRCTWGGP